MGGLGCDSLRPRERHATNAHPRVPQQPHPVRQRQGSHPAAFGTELPSHPAAIGLPEWFVNSGRAWGPRGPPQPPGGAFSAPSDVLNATHAMQACHTAAQHAKSVSVVLDNTPHNGRLQSLHGGKRVNCSMVAFLGSGPRKASVVGGHLPCGRIHPPAWLCAHGIDVGGRTFDPPPPVQIPCQLGVGLCPTLRIALCWFNCVSAGMPHFLFTFSRSGECGTGIYPPPPPPTMAERAHPCNNNRGQPRAAKDSPEKTPGAPRTLGDEPTDSLQGRGGGRRLLPLPNCGDAYEGELAPVPNP